MIKTTIYGGTSSGSGLATVDLTNNIGSTSPDTTTATIPVTVKQTGTDSSGKPIFSITPSGTASIDQPKTGCSLTTLDQCMPDLTGQLSSLGTWLKYAVYAIVALAIITVVMKI